MENEVLRDILLVITVLVIFALGFFIMKRLDKFLKENYQSNFSGNNEKPTRIVQNEDASDKMTFKTNKIIKTHRRK